MPQSDDEGFLARWSRRKRATAEGKVVPADAAEVAVVVDGGELGEAATASPEQAPHTAREGGQGRGVLKRVLTEADFADVDFAALDFKSDYTRFMQHGVPDAVRNKALRQLWASDPIMANMDGLHDWWDDYTDAAVAVPAGTLKTAYRIGKGFLSDDEVAQWEALGKPVIAPPAVAAATPAVPMAATDATDEGCDPDSAGGADAAAAVEPAGESSDMVGKEASPISTDPSPRERALATTPRDMTDSGGEPVES